MNHFVKVFNHLVKKYHHPNGKYEFKSGFMHFQRVGIWIFLFLVISQAYGQNSLDFDGSDDRVICGKDSSINLGGKSFTLEAWIYPTAWKNSAWEGNIICKEDNSSNNGYMMRCGDGGKLNCAFGQGTSTWVEKTTATAVLKLNVWQHVVFSCGWHCSRFHEFHSRYDQSHGCRFGNRGSFWHLYPAISRQDRRGENMGKISNPIRDKKRYEWRILCTPTRVKSLL
jgi:hypothetical protein